VELDASQAAAEALSLETAAVVRRLVVPRLLQVAHDRGWWDPEAPSTEVAASAADPGPLGRGSLEIVAIDASRWAQLSLAPRVIAPADATDGHALIEAALRDGASASATVDGSVVVGLAVIGPEEDGRRRELLTVGVAPAFRQRGLAGALLDSAMTVSDRYFELRADVTLAERDPIEPLERDLRAEIARRLLDGAGFEIRPTDPDLRQADPLALGAVRRRQP
jgi:ribosomal protein S18 acetylase RimI-like enzyme